MDPWRSHAGRRRVQHTDSHAVAHPPRRRSPLRSHRTASARARAQPGATSDARRTVAAIRNPIGYPTRRDPAPVWYKRSRTDRLRYGANRRDTRPRSTCHDRMPGAGRCGVYEGSPGTPPVSEQTQWFGIDSRLYDHAGRGYPGITARDPDAQHGALPGLSRAPTTPLQSRTCAALNPSVAHLCHH